MKKCQNNKTYGIKMYKKIVVPLDGSELAEWFYPMLKALP